MPRVALVAGLPWARTDGDKRTPAAVGADDLGWRVDACLEHDHRSSEIRRAEEPVIVQEAVVDHFDLVRPLRIAQFVVDEEMPRTRLAGWQRATRRRSSACPRSLQCRSVEDPKLAILAALATANHPEHGRNPRSVPRTVSMIAAATSVGGSCSQNLRTCHPAVAMRWFVSASRARFRWTFSDQYAAFVLATVWCSGHPCQKQPSMNTATRARVKTKIGASIQRRDGSVVDPVAEPDVVDDLPHGDLRRGVATSVRAH